MEPTIIVKNQRIFLSSAPLLTQAQIQKRVAEMGRQLSETFLGKDPIVIGVLHGAAIFHGDLIRAMSIPLQVDYLRVASYEGTQTSGQVRSVFGLCEDVRDRHVILVEDIIDTGLTMAFLLDHLQNLAPASLTKVALLYKPDQLRTSTPLSALMDHVGFVIPPKFVVGYGLDYEQYLRNLPEIYEVQKIEANL